MAQRVHRFNIDSPPSGGIGGATTERTDFPPGIVTAITIEIPSGHAGKTGIAIFYGASQVIPASGQAYMSGNKKTIRYELEDPHPGGVGWFVDHFNSGKRTHRFRVAVELDEITTGTSLLPPVLFLRQFGETFAGTTTGGEPVPEPGGGGAVPRV